MLSRTSRFVLCALLLLGGLSAFAQEPRPVVLSPITDPEGVNLDYAWRYAAGDGAGRAEPDFDDSQWRPVRPALRRDELPRDWNGVGWFRRHLVIGPALQGKPVTVRFRGAGAGEVYLDGKLIARSGAAGNALETAGSHTDAAVVTFEGAPHVLAVRYRHAAAVVPPEGIGFQITLVDPALASRAAGGRSAIVHAMLIGVLLFLVFLHLALFAFDRRARENLFYAAEMAAFTGIVLNDSRTALSLSESVRAVLDAISGPLPPAAIFFGLLTYYGVRLRSYPRAWKLFAAIALVLAAAGFAAPRIQLYGWMFYFVAMVAEVVRVERSGYALRRGPVGIFLSTFAVFGLTIALQILQNLGVVQPLAGVSDLYSFGIVAFAAGMSLYLAATLGQSRIVEAENARKGEELARARELQLSMLPRTLPSVPGLDIAAATRTAAEVGGDYYDFRDAGDGALLLAFGDATGHGLAAGIVLIAAKALFASIDPAASPSLLLDECNRILASMQLQQHRMALTFARVDRHSIRLASAAMPPLLVHRAATGAVEELGHGGLPLGTRLLSSWPEAAAPIEPGDTILFASDGLAELLDPSGAQLGYQDLHALFAAAATRDSAAAVLEALLASADAYRSSRALEDDMTLVVVRA